MSQSDIFLRPDSMELNSLLGKQFKVLDDGFIRVVDYMGNDQSIVQAARVSYGIGTKKTSEDNALIRYLMRHQHTTPFEMCEIKFHVRVPMDCWRQWIRHRTASVNEYSTRYSIAIDSAQKTDSKQWRLQSATNKQGSENYLNEENGTSLSNKEKDLHKQLWSNYQDRLDLGVAREQARKDLPLSTYTEAYWKINLHNLFHFLQLRMDSHAQYEIRTYAEIIGNEIVKKWCPVAWGAFEEYSLHSLKLSMLETKIISYLSSSKNEEAINLLIDKQLLDIEGKRKKNREREELEKKLENLKINYPW